MSKEIPTSDMERELQKGVAPRARLAIYKVSWRELG